MLGQRVSHYRILEKIGEGGMGEVYLAEDTSLRRKVALKFLPAYMEQEEEAQMRFLREARSAAAIDHPYICKIHEVGEVQDRHFIVMEYVEGETLKETLAKGPLPLKDALKIALGIADAIEEAHSKKIVHRDLKPANIMLTRGRHPKVMDFGLAKRVSRDDQTEMDITAALTREGATLGTLTYMSPEQLRGQPVDTRTDVFSFGVVLYEMLTGVHPFRKNTQAETVNAIFSETPPAISTYSDDSSDLLQHTVQKMLAKDPDRRYQSIHEVRTNLEQLIEDPTASGIRKIERPGLVLNYRWLAAAGLLAVAMVAAIAIWNIFYTTPELQQSVVLADFDTGNPVMDRTLEDTVRAQFGKSSTVQILPSAWEERMFKWMVQPVDTKMTPQLAKDACEREGGETKAYLYGTLAQIGATYQVTLNAQLCQGQWSPMNSDRLVTKMK